MDYGFAVLQRLIVGKGDLQDFMPSWSQPADPLNEDLVVARLRELARKGKET